MCSNMWARPVLPMGSCVEPASTMVKKEKTGASGRSQMRMVRPFGSFLTVMRFSKDATSWAEAKAVRKRMRSVGLSMRCFIGPPKDRTDIPDKHVLKQPCLDECAGQKFEITWPTGRLSNGGLRQVFFRAQGVR